MKWICKEQKGRGRRCCLPFLSSQRDIVITYSVAAQHVCICISTTRFVICTCIWLHTWQKCIHLPAHKFVCVCYSCICMRTKSYELLKVLFAIASILESLWHSTIQSQQNAVWFFSITHACLDGYQLKQVFSVEGDLAYSILCINIQWLEKGPLIWWQYTSFLVGIFND